ADVATQTGNGKDGKGNNKQARTTASVANTNSNKPETNPGQGLLHRSDRANAVSQNTVKNKNLGGDPKADNTNSGGSNGGSNGNGGSNSNGGGRTSGDNAAMLKQKNQVSYRL
ncbi:MAG: hypothetical protein OEZ39_12895, partial [Gammaproteobacteria bacterium]|nr:hypothetical protein [Gammaproteobacteria bacterium]